MFSRLVSSGIFILLGIGLCWRAYNYTSPVDPSLVAPVLCIFLGMVLVITGITLAMRGGDFEAQEPLPSGESHIA